MKKCLCSIFFVGVILCGLCGRAAEVDVILIGEQTNATGQGYMRNIPRSFKINRSVLFFYSRFLNGEKEKK